MTLRVLYIHPGGAFSGALRSLLEMLQGMPPDAVTPVMLLPRGRAADEVARLGYPMVTVRGLSQFDSTRFGHYRGLRWLILLRELLLLPATLAGVLRARRLWRDVDLIHANEVTALPAALLAKAFFRKPLLVHVRSVQLGQGAPLRRRLLGMLLSRFADAVVAIDDTVRASLPPGVAAKLVRNCFAPQIAGAAAASEEIEARLHPGSLRVGMVGSLLALKGVYEFLEAARACAARQANIDFVLVGENPRRISGAAGWLLERFGFARDVQRDVREFISRHGLEGRVHLSGFTMDVAAIYRLLDVVCFPSHLGAVGRPVLEAAWFGVPCIAAVEEPSADTFVPGETGVQVPARDAPALARALLGLEARRDEVRRMGQAALALAQRNFDSRRNAAELRAIYEKTARISGSG